MRFFLRYFLLSVFLFGFPTVVFSASFDRNNVIGDRELTSSQAMGLSRIQSFLAAKGALGGLSFAVDGVTKTAAQIIYENALTYEISPEYLITRMQVEQGVITAGRPTDNQLNWATGYGRCDHCTPEQAAKYKGFDNQVAWGAKGVRTYIDDIASTGTTISGWGPGVTKTSLDGLEVTPENAATAALYTYTPWVGYHEGDENVGGNSLFYDIFTKWFNLSYPDGTLLQDVNTGGIYIIRNGKKLPFTRREAFFANYDPRDLIPASKVTLDAYETGQAISFANFSLLRSPSGTVYLYNDGKIRGISSGEVFRKLGYNPEEIQAVSWDTLKSFQEDRPITADDVFPAGILYQYKETGAVVYVDPKGVRHNIINRELLNVNFKGKQVVSVAATVIDQLPRGNDVLFPDGTLVSSHEVGSVYVISNGEKRAFTSAEAFTQLGYRWDNIIFTSKAALNLHPNGKPLTLDK